MSVDVEKAFAFFADAWNLEAITPPWLRFRISRLHGRWGGGRCSRTGYGSSVCRFAGGPRPSSGGPRSASPSAARGPYRRWEHTHRLGRVDCGTVVYDHVVYRLPYEPRAGLLASVTVRPWLTAIFDYRDRQTEARLR